MLIIHAKDSDSHPNANRRAFLRTGTMAVLSAGFWLNGNAVAYGQGESQANSPLPNSDFQLTRSKFAPHLSESFAVVSDSGPVYLQLVEVNDLKQASISRSALARKEDPEFKMKLQEESFTLLFRSTSETLLPQGTWTLDHDALGKMTLFLTPVIRSDGPWHFYEAVFNRLQE